MLTNLSEHSKRSWTVFKSEDAKKLENMNLFKDELSKILSKYLKNAGRFGQIIKVEDKKKFNDDIKKLEKDFLGFIQGKVKDTTQTNI